MSRPDKHLERMRQNPRGNWRIEEVASVCARFDVRCDAPRRGSHYTIAHSSQIDILTVPARRPIKAIYIVKVVKFIDSVIQARDERL